MSSPTLHLVIADSRHYHCLLLLLALAELSALFLLCKRGYPGLAFLFSPLALICLWRLHVQEPRGCRFYWREGDWWLERGGAVSLIEVQSHSACLPWVTCLVYTPVPNGRCQRAWIFADACDRESLRRLRVRLTLLR